jgi:transcriptional regulator with GAF, ATPase, and Fis domain
VTSRDPEAETSREAPSRLDDQAALYSVLEGTAAETGERFFSALVENLQRALGTMGAWIARLDEGTSELRALSMKMRGVWLEDYRYQVVGTPCETALSERRLVHIPERLVELYPGDPRMGHFDPVSYMGVPLLARDGTIIGQLAVLDDKPMPQEPRSMAIFKIFASRAAGELQRLEAERAIQEREAQLRLLLDGALDAIIDFDDSFQVRLINPAAQRLFGCLDAAPPADLRALLSDASRALLEREVAALFAPASERSGGWLAEGLQAVTCRGESFQAEATLSSYRLGSQRRLTLILRSVEERLAAERRITSLTREAQYLREELKAFSDYDQIVGSSAALLHALREVEQVAATDTSVLLLGETGTGKELFARALHARSKRAARPLIRVNCGAIPHALIESELFGHEKGAFTGASQRRDGRFVLADGGTIFLDEIGELPLELQPKLLRVLQEGELEPLGSSRTLKVDVRVVAATHRNLAECVKQGTFREDLYYRLAVFPIKIPPLRERSGDIQELARVFVDKYTRRMGRTLAPLSESALERLNAYAWPGNVRELQNVIERGVILSTRGVFELERALPDAARSEIKRPEGPVDDDRIRTADELLQLERDNIERALEKTGGKVAGVTGAAALLGTNPSTLNSRMRSLGIKRKGSPS